VKLSALFPLIFLFALLRAEHAAAPGTALRAGAAISDITPKLGAEIVGGFSPVPSTHVHDPLQARCLVLDDGSVRLALVVCDPSACIAALV
jgi:neutral ceramidase